MAGGNKAIHFQGAMGCLYFVIDSPRLFCEKQGLGLKHNFFKEL